MIKVSVRNLKMTPNMVISDVIFRYLTAKYLINILNNTESLVRKLNQEMMLWVATNTSKSKRNDMDA